MAASTTSDDLQLKQMIERLRELGQDCLRAQSTGEVRAALDRHFGAFPSAALVTSEAVDIAGVGAEWIQAPNADHYRTILYLHGGGYAGGSIASHRELAARLSKAAAARCLVLDYRLAPENPFPAAVDDATAAYQWLLLDQKYQPTRIAIAGDSAGGGLTIATLVNLRDKQLPLPGAAACISPWVDLAVSGASALTNAERDALVSRDILQMFVKMYLGDRDPRIPLASPLYADLRGLPPLLIQVGSSEVLLDDAKQIGERAQAAGVSVELEVWPNMQHVWHWFAPTLDKGQQAIEQIGGFIRQRTQAPA
ncbi:MAG: alpha/beta hydrolase [Candidatus Binataceae bacterium]|nr:alpha/beta hydrolase [Candidatus Binataceae bacterium]